LVQEVGVNLIITDYCMPGMTGYDLLRRVKVRDLQTLYSPSANLSIHSRICVSENLSLCVFNFAVQGSSSLKDIPVVIMSSENVPARINR
jgi:two-component response regulator (ARR-A family)